jgi:hypothetical protein
MTQTPFLTATQRSISRMVTDTIGFKWSSYNAADRAVAHRLLSEHARRAPVALSSADFSKMMEGKKYKRTKDFVQTLADAMKDEIWNRL